jgi:hypothetical protein
MKILDGITAVLVAFTLAFCLHDFIKTAYTATEYNAECYAQSKKVKTTPKKPMVPEHLKITDSRFLVNL